MLPTFIGIGAPKAATTWLYKCLKEHPDVFLAQVKEVNFFAYLDSIEGRLAEYESHFVGSEGHAAVGEISVSYISSQLAPGRIRAQIPDAKIIVSLRNPYEQVNSHFWHLRRQNFHTWQIGTLPKDVHEAIERFPQLLLEPALYYTHLQRWFDTFPSEQIHVMLYDDVQSEPLAVLQRVFGFLGVDDTFVPPGLNERGAEVRRGVSPRNETANRIYKHVYGVLNRNVYHRMKGVLGPRRATHIKELLRARQTLEKIFFRPGYTPLSSDDRRRLAPRFEDEIRGLSRLTGRDLTAWSQGNAVPSRPPQAFASK